MVGISQLIQKNFSANIAFLEKEYPETFTKLLEYESAVDGGHYKERYELIYEDAFFDVVESNNGMKLYASSSELYAKDVLSSVSMSSEDECFETHYRHAPSLATSLHQANRPHELLKLHKFVFFGTGLGTHLTSLIQAHQLKVALIVEDDLELFRLSLFVTEYHALAETTQLFFSIFDTDAEFSRVAQDFFSYQYYYNSTMKFFSMLNQSDAKLKQFQLALATQPELTFLVNESMRQMLLPLANIQHQYQFLEKHSSFAEIQKPFLFLAAGPSLQKSITLLQKHQNRFVIVAVSAIIAYLESQKIHVDIILHLDVMQGADIHFQKIHNPAYFKTTLCLFSAKTPEKILRLFPKKNIYLFEDATRYLQNSLKPSAPCVGSLGFQILLLLRVQKLYLLGLDLSVDAEGNTHSASHSHTQKLDTKKTLQNQKSVEYKSSLIRIEGNHQAEVLSTPHFMQSIDSINMTTEYFKRSTLLYNLSSGAAFKGIPPQDVASLAQEHQEEKVKLQLLKTYFSQAEKQLLQTKHAQLKKLLTSLSHSADTQEMFLRHLEQLAQDLAESELLIINEIYKVIESFFRSNLPPIFDFYNRNKRGNFQEIERVFQSEMQAIIQTYIETTEVLL